MNSVRNYYENKLESLVTFLTNIIKTKEGTSNKKYGLFDLEYSFTTSDSSIVIILYRNEVSKVKNLIVTIDSDTTVIDKLEDEYLNRILKAIKDRTNEDHYKKSINNINKILDGLDD